MNEISVANELGLTLYYLILDPNSQIWNPATSSFELRQANHWTSYALPLVDSTPPTGIYTGSFPSAILGGTYGIECYKQGGVTPDVQDGPPIGSIPEFIWGVSIPVTPPTPPPTNVGDALLQAVTGPKSVTGDAGSVTQYSLNELIMADAYLAGKDAANTNRRGIRFSKLVPDGTAGTRCR